MAGLRRLSAAAALVGGISGTTPALGDPHALMSLHVPALVALHRARFVAPMPQDSVLRLAVALPLRQQTELNSLLAALYDPASPRYRQYLSVDAFTAQFGPTSQDYDTAVRFFVENGLRVTGVAPNRFLIDIAGPAADIERVFHVGLGLYRHPGENRLFFAPDHEPALDLAVPVLHVTGLDDAELARPRLIRSASGDDQHSNRSDGSGSGPDGNFIGTDMRAAYYPAGTLTGAGQSLGLMELAGYDNYDVQNFFHQYGPANNVAVTGISTDGASLRCAGRCDDSEQALDIEYAISMAPGLRQVQVYVGYNAEDVLNRMATDNSSAQLSTSWGWNENFETDDALFKEMAAQGQSILTASGDWSSLRASGPWPEEDANITAVGGTNLVTDGPSGAWLRENGWSGSAGGPSLDRRIKIEPYQLSFINAQNKGSIALRNVPDISGAAAYFYICADRTCNGNNGGTSFAAPIWAGIVALANEEAAAAGKPRIGFLNPALYALGASANLFHDITKGHSGKHSCTPSYDLVTGLGTPPGQPLIDALANGP
jgi:subtilase family serine protease